ncbi:MAG: AMP-binding protein, partial [Chitinophagales bacterium]
MIDFTRVFDVIYYQQKKFVKADSLNAKVNGKWVSYNTHDVVDNMNSVSMALLGSGIKKGDAISIIGNNRPEWNFVDLGIMQIGAVTVPIYPNISEEDYVYIVNNAEVKLLFVSSKELYEKMMHIRTRIPTVQEIFTFDIVEGATHWKEFLKRAIKSDIRDVMAVSPTIDQHEIACMIYTSGTTGFPKGVMLSHYNVVENMKSVDDVLPINETHTALSFLPLNHVLEKLVIYCYMMKGVSIYYAESLDTIGENLREVKPHFFTCVPRLLEKVYERIVSKGLELKGAKKGLFFWALRLGEKWDNQKSPGIWYGLQLNIARKLIFSKWKEALGGNIFAICSGAAPLNAKIGKVFTAAGITIMEGYGLTETSPVISVNRFNYEDNMLGSVGPVVPGVQVKIAEDGEILCKGPNIMVGYYKLPDKTAEAIDKDGWFHSG